VIAAFGVAIAERNGSAKIQSRFDRDAQLENRSPGIPTNPISQIASTVRRVIGSPLACLTHWSPSSASTRASQNLQLVERSLMLMDQAL